MVVKEGEKGGGEPMVLAPSELFVQDVEEGDYVAETTVEGSENVSMGLMEGGG